jgi:cytidylate kinase
MSHRGTSIEGANHLAHSMLQTMASEREQPVWTASPRLFVTISRQPGIDAGPLAHHLAEAMGNDWTAWDHELIEKVASDHGINQHLIESIENQRHSWLDDVFSSFSTHANRDFPDEARIYKRVVVTLRALANAGHTVLVGNGGRFVTAGMQGGRHIRLVAPLPVRIATLARQLNLPAQSAAQRLVEWDSAREDFYRRYWPGHSLSPVSYELTINSAELSVHQMVECILPLLRAKPAVMSDVAAAS